MIIRQKYLDQIERGFTSVPVIVLIGARQVGKTSLMKMFQFDGAMLFLNGQDPEVSGLFAKLSELEAYLKVYLDPDLKGLLLIDEFQYIPGVSTMLKLLTDSHDELKILCSGSSSLDIQQTVEESLAGRLRVIEVLSLSFSEYVSFRDQKLFELYSGFSLSTPDSALTAPFIPLLNEYLTYGGLPRAALTPDSDDKIAILDDIYKTYLIRDVRSYVRNEHFVGFNKLLRMLAAQIGNLVYINELSRESGLPYRVAEEYLDLLSQMYIIKLLEPYATNSRAGITKMKKVYFYDLGMRNRINSGFQEIEYRPDNGALFENYVLLELSRNLKPGGIIRFYRTKDGTEVDFVIEQPAARFAVECKFSILNKPLQIRGLNKFGQEEDLEALFIVNRNLNWHNGNQHIIQGYLAGIINQANGSFQIS